jgi:ATP-binding cassette subfamily C (CFTR/MRP) protein 1
LSAVDAHVGKALFENAIMGLRAQGKTVLLVTHALHFLPEVDYIYTMQNGRIVEEGSYAELIKNDGPFGHLIAEFGGQGEKNKEDRDAAEEGAIEQEKEKGNVDTKKAIVRLTRKNMGKAAGTGKLEVSRGLGVGLTGRVDS